MSVRSETPATEKGCFETLLGFESCTCLLGCFFYTSVYKYIVIYADDDIFLGMNAYIYRCLSDSAREWVDASSL